MIDEKNSRSTRDHKIREALGLDPDSRVMDAASDTKCPMCGGPARIVVKCGCGEPLCFCNTYEYRR